MSTATLRTQIQSALPRFDLPLVFRERAEPERMASGVGAIDALTGGVPRGAMTEIFGPASSGRTTVMVSLLARATRNDEYCALIDAHDAFDPRGAAAAGADLSRVLWVRCGGHVENSLKAVDRIVQAGGFGLILYDLADAEARAARRIALASWFRLRHGVENTRSALVVIGRECHARSCSTLQLALKSEGAMWSPHLLRGLRVEAETRKHQMSRRARFAAERFAI